MRVPQSVKMNDPVANGTLWLGNIEGKHERKLTSAGIGVADPVPDPNGAEVTFVHVSSTGKATVDLLNLATGAVRELARVDNADFYGEFEASTVLSVWQPVS